MREFFSLRGVFKTRNLAVLALLTAISFVLNQYTTIYLTPSFKLITFAFLPCAVAAAMYGPWAALAIGFATDIVGYLFHPVGPFFFGYTLTAMLECFLYACFLYRQPIKVWRVAASRLIITVVIELGLNYLWGAMLYGVVASGYFTGLRFIVRFSMIPVYTALIVLVCRASQKIERRAAVSKG